jgi:phosphohistidine phosphatase SixA
MVQINVPPKANWQRTVAIFVGLATGLLCTTFAVVQSFALAAANGRTGVILVRHGDAPGSGEPPGFKLSDCSTQRNLTDKGRERAGEIGNIFRSRHIRVGKIMASRLCRTRQTAKLMKIGPVESNSAFDDLAENQENASQLIARERAIIDAWKGPGVLVIVTHGSNIKALTGLHVDQGGMVDVETNSGQLVADYLIRQPSKGAGKSYP